MVRTYFIKKIKEKVMKRLRRLTKEERLKIVVDIVQKLKRIPANNELGYIDVYKQEYPAMKKLMEIFREYISQEEEDAVEINGKLEFEEMNRIIYYVLPVNERRNPLFKMEWKNK